MKKLGYFDELAEACEDFLEDDFHKSPITVMDSYVNGKLFSVPNLWELDLDSSFPNIDDLPIPFDNFVIETQVKRSKDSLGRGMVILCKRWKDRLQVASFGWRPESKSWAGPYLTSIPMVGAIDRRPDGSLIRINWGIQSAKYTNHGDVNKLSHAFHQNLHNFMVFVFGFLDVMACANVGYSKVNCKTNKKIRRLLPALQYSSYHELSINPSYGVSSGIGGDRRRPREHFRRGHSRRLASGEVIWIQDQVVNKDVGGKIYKGYVKKRVPELN